MCAAEIYHGLLVLAMLPLSLLAQRFFRCSSDNETYFDKKLVSVVEDLVILDSKNTLHVQNTEHIEDVASSCSSSSPCSDTSHSEDHKMRNSSSISSDR